MRTREGGGQRGNRMPACQRGWRIGTDVRDTRPPLLRWCTALVQLPWGRRQPLPPPPPEAARVEDLHSVLLGVGGGGRC